MSDQLSNVKEQLCVTSPYRGRRIPNERSKHGVPRQQDLTQQQSPTESPPQKQHVSSQSSSQPLKQQSRKESMTTKFHPEPKPQVKHDAPRQEPVHERQESRPNQEPQQPPWQKQLCEFKRIHQQLMMDGESDLVLWKQVHRKCRLIKCQSDSELSPVSRRWWSECNSDWGDDRRWGTASWKFSNRCICCELCATKTWRSQWEKTDRKWSEAFRKDKGVGASILTWSPSVWFGQEKNCWSRESHACEMGHWHGSRLERQKHVCVYWTFRIQIWQRCHVTVPRCQLHQKLWSCNGRLRT